MESSQDAAAARKLDRGVFADRPAAGGVLPLLRSPRGGADAGGADGADAGADGGADGGGVADGGADADDGSGGGSSSAEGPLRLNPPSVSEGVSEFVGPGHAAPTLPRAGVQVYVLRRPP